MENIKDFNDSRKSALNLLVSPLDDETAGDVKTKFNNLCGKTGSYGVPAELFQKRTPRKNRALISWQAVNKNNLTIEQLSTFEGDVVVEFVNSDFFDSRPDDEIFNTLKNRLGSDLPVSSMISIRSQDGKSDSQAARNAFSLLELEFPNWRKELIRRKPAEPGARNLLQGNDKIEGFVYVKIAGGQQDTTRSHEQGEGLFNPACEYAGSQVSVELDLVMLYFALHSMSDAYQANPSLRRQVENEIEVLAALLRHCKYDDGNLLDYCNNHPSLKFGKGRLVDPIQVEQIHFSDFAITDTQKPEHLNLTHNEPVENERYIFDKTRGVILSPARPQNVFWSKHLSNMMQQHFTLEGYFAMQDEWYLKRHALDPSN